MEHTYQNLYNNPRPLYKYYTLSKDYVIEYKRDNETLYLFTPNIPKKDMKKNNKVVDKWRLIVFEGWLFYSSPAFFNDPFDSALPPVPEVVPTINEREAIIKELKQLHNLKREDEDRLLICDDFDTSLLMVLNKMGIANEIQNEILKNQKYIGKRYKEEIATVCFSETNNQDLMWAHYANSYSGFCIEYDFAKLSDSNFRKGIGKVFYSDKRPNVREFDNNFDYTRAVLSTKASCWEYEKEWRSIDIVPYKLYSKQIYPIINVMDSVTAVYFGCKMALNYQEEIIQHYKNSTVKIYRMVLDKDEFKYNFIQCN